MMLDGHIIHTRSLYSDPMNKQVDIEWKKCVRTTVHPPLQNIQFIRPFLYLSVLYASSNRSLESRLCQIKILIVYTTLSFLYYSIADD